MHQEGTNPTYGCSYGSWLSSKMSACRSCFLCCCFSNQNLVMCFHASIPMTKIKDMCLQKKCMRTRCGRNAAVHWAHGRASTNPGGHDPLPLPNGRKANETDVRLRSRVGVDLSQWAVTNSTSTPAAHDMAQQWAWRSRSSAHWNADHYLPCSTRQ